MKTHPSSRTLVTAAILLALPVLSPAPVLADGRSKKKPDASDSAKDPKKDDKSREAEKKENRRKMADQEKKKENDRKKPEAAKKPAEPEKKPDVAKKPAEPAKKPEPAKPTPPPAPAAAAAGPAVATVTYEKGKAANLTGRDEALEKARAALKQNPNAKFVVIGHADDTSYAEANQEISENRANFLAAHLRTNGIPKDRVESRGVGNTQAVKGQPNRRAVVEIKK